MKKYTALFIILFALIIFTGCTDVIKWVEQGEHPSKTTSSDTTVAKPVSQDTTPVTPTTKLPEPTSTNSKPYPTSGWDVRYDELIKKELVGKVLMDTEPSRMNFCPKWGSLSKDARIVEFSKYLRAITVYESSTTLNSRMVETAMGTDPITGMQVASEGLFQLSYQDAKNYPACVGIDYKKDKGLSGKDLKRTIFQPEIQFKCTVAIMDRIMIRHSDEKAVGQGRYGLGRYWSVIRTERKADKLKAKMIEYKSNCF